jgi:hypothetical protein
MDREVKMGKKGGRLNSDTTILLETGVLLDMAYDRVISIR